MSAPVNEIGAPPARLYLEEPPGKPLYVHAAALLEKAALLWAHRRRLGRAVVIVMAITAGLSLLLPNRYTATVSLMPPDTNPMSGLSALLGMKSPGASLSGQFGDLMRLRTPGQLYIQLMQSRVVEDRLIARFGLMQVYGARKRPAARRRLAAGTRFSEDRKSGIVSVSVTDAQAGRASDLANGYAAELGRMLADLASSAGRREREYFEAQLLAARQELGQSTQRLSEFAGSHAVLDVPEQSRALVESTAAIEGQLIASQAELSGLQQIYAERHERVQQARAKIAELKRQLGQIRGRGAPGSPPEGAQPTVKTLSALAVPYADLYRRVKITEAVVATLSQQYEIARLQESRHVADIQVMDPAEAPERKSSPHRLTLTLGAGLLCLLLGCARILAVEWWRRVAVDNPWRKVLAPVVAQAGATRSCWRDRIARLRPARRAPFSSGSSGG